jgi:ribosomal protein S18 acetylase RimI-like enzyme
MVDFNVRLAGKEDLGKIKELAVATFRQTYGWYNDLTIIEKYIQINFNRNQLANEWNNQNSHFFIGEKGGLPKGYIKLNTGNAQTDLKDENGLEIERIYLLSSMQGKGCGRIMFAKAIEMTKKLKKDFLWLGVWDQNENAIAFYESQGMQIFSSHVFDFGGEPQNDFLMRFNV